MSLDLRLTRLRIAHSMPARYAHLESAMLAEMHVIAQQRPNGLLSDVPPSIVAVAVLRAQATKLFAPGGRRIIIDGDKLPPGHWLHGQHLKPWLFTRGEDIAAPCLRDLFPLMVAAAREPMTCIVQGRMNCAVGAVTRRCNAAMTDAPSTILPLDLDGLEVPEGMDSTSLEAVRWLIRQHLPPVFADADCIVQQSASAGLKGARVSCHLFFALDAPRTAYAKRVWAQQINSAARVVVNGVASKDPIDAMVLRQAQAIFIGEPVFARASDDPFAHHSRWTLIEGTSPTVPARALAAVELSPAQRDQIASTTAKATPLTRERLSATADKTLEDAIALFWSGHVHTTCTQAAWVAVQLGIAPATVQKRLEAGFAAATRGGVRLDAASFASDLARVPEDMAQLLAEGAGLTTLAGSFKVLRKRYTTDKSDDVAWSLFRALLRSDPTASRQSVAGLFAGEPPSARVRAAIDREWAQEEFRRRTARRRFAPGRAVHQIKSLDEIPADLSGVILVRAPMGSGKTEILGRRILARHAGNAVHISPRVALVDDVAVRLNLAHYKHPEDHRAGLATCLPSVAKAEFAHRINDAGAIVIDEVCACLDLLASTGIVGDRGPATLTRLRALVKDAHTRPVWCLDANCGEEEAQALERLGADELTVYEIDDSTSLEGVTVHIATLPLVEAEIHATLAAGLRALVFTDSKRLVRTWPVKFPAWASRMLAIFAENAGDPAQARFCATPNDEIVHHALIVATPTIDTGLSITRHCVDLVAAVTHGRTDAEAVAQQLGRYRPLAASRVLLAHHLNLPAPRATAEEILSTWATTFALGNAWEADDFSAFVAHRRAAKALRLRASKVSHLLAARGATIIGEPTTMADADGVEIAVLDDDDEGWYAQHREASNKANAAWCAAVSAVDILKHEYEFEALKQSRHSGDTHACWNWRARRALRTDDVGILEVAWFAEFGTKAPRTLLGAALDDDRARDSHHDAHRVAALRHGITLREQVAVACVAALCASVGAPGLRELRMWGHQDVPAAQTALTALGEELLRATGVDPDAKAPAMIRQALRLIGVRVKFDRKYRDWSADTLIPMEIIDRARARARAGGSPQASPFDTVAPIGTTADDYTRRLQAGGMRKDTAATLGAMLAAGGGRCCIDNNALKAAGIERRIRARFRAALLRQLPPWLSTDGIEIVEM